MGMHAHLLGLLAGLCLALPLGAPAAAAGPAPLAGDIQVPAGTTLHGDIDLLAGEVRVDGTLQGSVSLSAGQVLVGSAGAVTGSVTVGVGQVVVQPGGRIDGPVTVGGSGTQPIRCPADAGRACVLAGAAGIGVPPVPPHMGGMVRRLVTWPWWLPPALHPLGWLGLLALALPLAALFPRAVGTVVAQIEREPGRSLGAGLAVLVLALPILLLVAITIVGIPVAMAAALGLVVAWLLGYVGVALLVGRATLRAGGVAAPNPLLGVLVGSALVAVAEWVPVLGGLAWLAVAALGLGAVFLTRFGTASPWPRGGAGHPEGGASPPPAAG
jgi:hypothetical protein